MFIVWLGILEGCCLVGFKLYLGVEVDGFEVGSRGLYMWEV